VLLWPWPLTSGLWSYVTWCNLGGQHLCQVWNGYDLPFQSKDDYNFPLSATLKSQFLRLIGVFLRLFGGRWVKFQIYNPQKALSWPERRILRGDVSKDAICGSGEEKKQRNFHASSPIHTTVLRTGRKDRPCVRSILTTRKGGFLTPVRDTRRTARIRHPYNPRSTVLQNLWRHIVNKQT